MGKYEAAAVATQSKYPWRATARTVLAFVVGLAASWGLVIEALGVDPGLEWVVGSIAVAGAITRLMAVPFVNVWLTRLKLGATPASVVETPTKPAN